MKNVIKKLELEHKASHSEIAKLLSDNKFDDEIFAVADNVRKKNVGDEVYLRALIEFSNICKNDCKYCGIRVSNKSASRYSLTDEEIVNCAKLAVDAGFKTLVLQSGESEQRSTEQLVELIKELKNFDVAITLSLGEKTFEQYKAYREAGANRYLLRIETTDKNLYQKMHPNMSFENRLQCLKNLKVLGFETGTGCLVGLPEQSLDSLANDILFFKEFGADMVGIGPLISHPQTPLNNAPNGDFLLALKVMALTRLLLPEINIPATTAMETLNQNGRTIALQCGANVVMPNVTEDFYRDKYDIYPNKNSTHIGIDEYLKMLENKFAHIGRTIKMSRGDSLKWQNANRRIF